MNSNIDIYDALIAAGAPEDKARAAAAAVPEQSNMATKADLLELENRMTWKMISTALTVGGICTAIILTVGGFVAKYLIDLIQAVN